MVGSHEWPGTCKCSRTAFVKRGGEIEQKGVLKTGTHKLSCTDFVHNSHRILAMKADTCQ
jgi:hypothetical protein